MQRFLKTPIIAMIVVVLAAGAAMWWWHARSDARLSFRTVIVKRGDLVATVNATGTVEPEEVVDVGAQVAGQILSFGNDKNGNTIDYGSIVEEGTVLAQIDDSLYAADVALAKAQLEQDKAGEVSAVANLEQMKAKLVQAEADWRRSEELFHSKLEPLSVYDSDKANYEVAKANVAVAEAALTQAKAATVQAEALLLKAQRNLDFCTIKSPVKGVIIDRRVNIGQTVVSSLNTPSLFLIAKDLTRMQIWVAVNEADVGRIVSGAPVTFTCDAFPGKEFNGRVGKVRLNATMTQNVVMYTVEVTTGNPDNVLLPYLTANVHFVVRKDPNVLLVPNSALRWSPSSPKAIVADARSQNPIDPSTNSPPETNGPKEKQGIIWLKDGEYVRPVPVKVGPSDGVNTAVASDGLQEGQEVVTGETMGQEQGGTKSPFVPKFIRH